MTSEVRHLLRRCGRLQGRHLHRTHPPTEQLGRDHAAATPRRPRRIKTRRPTRPARAPRRARRVERFLTIAYLVLSTISDLGPGHRGQPKGRTGTVVLRPKTGTRHSAEPASAIKRLLRPGGLERETRQRNREQRQRRNDPPGIAMPEARRHIKDEKKDAARQCKEEQRSRDDLHHSTLVTHPRTTPPTHRPAVRNRRTSRQSSAVCGDSRVALVDGDHPSDVG